MCRWWLVAREKKTRLSPVCRWAIVSVLTLGTVAALDIKIHTSHCACVGGELEVGGEPKQEKNGFQ